MQWRVLKLKLRKPTFDLQELFEKLTLKEKKDLYQLMKLEVDDRIIPKTEALEAEIAASEAEPEEEDADDTTKSIGPKMLSDDTMLKSSPWSDLKKNMVDIEIDYIENFRVYNAAEKKLLAELVKAQRESGDFEGEL